MVVCLKVVGNVCLHFMASFKVFRQVLRDWEGLLSSHSLIPVENYSPRGARVAQSVVSDLGSGHDLVVCEFKPRVGFCAVNAEPALDPMSSSLCPSPAYVCVHGCALSRSQKINMNKKILP